MPTCPTLRIALPVPLPQTFDYLPPPGSPDPGAGDTGRRVRVPFGNRELVGMVESIGTADDPATLREALQWLDGPPLLGGELHASLRWLARYTHAPLGEVIATALPAPLRRGDPLPDTHGWGWELTVAGHEGRSRLRDGTRPRRLAELLGDGTLAEEVLAARMDGWREAGRALLKRGFAQRVAMAAAIPAAHPLPGPEPNPQQQVAIEAITAADGFQPFLLDGVTGSGKTEVYLQAIAHCLAQGRQALVLVPEIGLTPQMLARFRARLGIAVHALHSGLNDNERARVWAAASRGEARVIVGTRSAVFTPLPQAGLLIVDEEHDGSYKQQDGIRYHARDFALVRGKALDIPVVLGSATPSLESLHNARAGRYTHLRLQQRAGDARPPAVRVFDVRKRPLQDGLSPEVLAGIEQHLRAGNQVLVFKNRRGYAPVLLCHDCGWTAPCRRCSTPLHATPMTVHGAGRRLQCHHCGARAPVPLACPDCGSLALQPQGIGTERLEERLLQLFPDFPVLRIDRGTTARRDALEQTLAALGEQPGILVGTQILAKGHDLPRLTLVVVVGIDEGLFSADFRASEKLAQQLIQVAGRAGRADRPGEVWLQTHHPDNALLHTLVNGGYHAFADAELAQREAAGFPPFAHLALLRAEAKQVEQANEFLAAVKHAMPADSPVERYGPMPAPMPRRAGFQRTQLLLSATQRRALHGLLDALVPQIYALPQARRVRWSLDVDPVDLY
ncbi:MULTISPECIES: primosomal protein N' [Stenotrophomonas]|uniref:Replication restart protein PriA n=1 Tax=Stenotrophomonas nitritireducens TaxID=83617 RepID=A0ABR5NMM7_9GAMM|nr:MULTISPECIES: primosomal protein N' [Stenotrophomonas]KQN97354.1 primosomal protein N' [Stenotrophomonas sp. Leaf70]KRG59360.1 primosome assembly protein PriA [Stenotrophomonas nitritireducens]